jgi:protein-S-isoprenylcysteine O-methyltransferase Ste14
MKLLNDWGFRQDSWRGARGEYLVVLQGLLLVSFVVLPVQSVVVPPLMAYVLKAIALGLAAFASVLLGKGLLDLGENLTPLPYPRDDGQLVQTGVYSIVRHCLYSGLILLAIAFTAWTVSWPHSIATLVLFIFFDRKAAKEERWLSEKYPDYNEYQTRVKKLLPWLY